MKSPRTRQRLGAKITLEPDRIGLPQEVRNVLTPALVTHTALKPRGRRSQIGLRQEVRNEQGNEGERAPTAATGDRRRVKSPRTRQRWGAKLALGPEEETVATSEAIVTGWRQQIRLGVLLLGKVPAPAIPTEDHLRHPLPLRLDRDGEDRRHFGGDR